MTAALLTGCGSASTGYEPSKNAEFRHLARNLIENIDPVCPMTMREDLLDRYDPVLKRFSSLKDKLGGTQLATDLRIAEADEAYRRSITVVECIEPDGPDTARYFSNHIESMSRDLSKMEAIAQRGGTD